ncbi:MAG: nucleotide exchange factor GrpE, partial [Proteobacteria bacterium]|nr:nucleotide exchange factor GrpE [Pseudomonadota bacterium]
MNNSNEELNKNKTEEASNVENRKESSVAGNRSKKKRKGKRSLAKAEKENVILNKKLKDAERQSEQYHIEMVEYKNRFLRAMADLENYRKSIQKELEEVRTRTKESLYIDIISILDNFERALQSFKKDNIDDHTISVIKGIEMIYKQFHNLLEKEGVKPYSSVGERFDPRKHHAL